MQVVEALQRILLLPLEVWAPELLANSSNSQNISRAANGSNGPNDSNASSKPPRHSLVNPKTEHRKPKTENSNP